jgi:hypothetical protein
MKESTLGLPLAILCDAIAGPDRRISDSTSQAQVQGRSSYSGAIYTNHSLVLIPTRRKKTYYNFVPALKTSSLLLLRFPAVDMLNLSHNYYQVQLQSHIYAIVHTHKVACPLPCPFATPLEVGCLVDTDLL